MTKIFETCNQEPWDKYASAHQAAHYSHRYCWGRTLSSIYDMPLHCLGAGDMQSGRLRLSGILPLILFAPPQAQRRLISLPFTDAAGLICEDQRSGEQLILEALRLAHELDAVHVEIRQSGGLPETALQKAREMGWHHVGHAFKTGLLRPLPRSAAVLWASLAPKVRNQVRKARRFGCTVAIGKEELLDDFYAVFSENMRDLGSPVHSRELFRELLAAMPEKCRILVVCQDGLPAACGMVFRHGPTLANPWASSLRRSRPFCANMLLYWSMLEYAIETRCRWFDFGRSSPGAPTHRFKRQWGACRTDLVWHVFSRNSAGWRPDSESLQMEKWKRMDLSSFRREGPQERKWISL